MTRISRTGCSLFIAFLLTMLCSMLPSEPAVAADTPETESVAVLPFAMHAGGNLAYLQDGIRDMLASRLAANAGVSIVERSSVDAQLKKPGKTIQLQEAQILAGKLGADYVVAGSLTSLAGAVSVDATVFPAKAGSTAQSFYASAPEENKVIGAVNQLSWDIAEKVFNKTRPASMQPAASRQIPEASDQTLAAYRTEHPDKAFRTQGTGSMMGSPFIMNDGIRGFTKTQTFDFASRAMDVGDVDGDGQDDLILADSDYLRVYAARGSRLQEIASLPLSATERVHSVSAADLNNDGRDEIYVSANNEDMPVSFGTEFKDNALNYIFRKARWYVRVVDLPGEEETLVGQKGWTDEPLLPGIFRLVLNDGKLQKESKLALPSLINLFDFSMADLNGDGSHEIIVLTQDYKLLVLNAGGNLLWRSSEYYGGSSRYVGELDSSKGRIYQTEMIEGERIYIPSRIIIDDINDDGLPDVIVNRNISTASRILEHVKNFSSSEMHALTWSGIGLTELWRTKKIDGYIADYQLRKKTTEEGEQPVLFVNVVLEGGMMNFISSNRSTVLMYNLAKASEEDK